MLAVGACSSGDDDGITAERDTALEELKAAKAARDAAQGRVTELEGLLETANGMVTDLQGQLDMANSDLGAANGMVTDLQGQLDTANGDVTRLMGELADATDNADAIQGMLDTANADVTRLMGELDTANSNTDAVQGMLDMANADVTRLMGELDTANARADTAEGEVTRLQGELDVANARIAEIEELAEDVLAAAALAERKARESGVRTAIMANRVGTVENEFPTGITVQAVTRDAAGKLTVDVNGDVDDEYAGGETTAGSGAWNSVTLTKTDAGTEAVDTVVFYTDIAAPSDMKFIRCIHAGSTGRCPRLDDCRQGGVFRLPIYTRHRLGIHWGRRRACKDCHRHL